MEILILLIVWVCFSTVLCGALLYYKVALKKKIKKPVRVFLIALFWPVALVLLFIVSVIMLLVEITQ